jgi:hypothetical protein
MMLVQTAEDKYQMDLARTLLKVFDQEASIVFVGRYVNRPYVLYSRKFNRGHKRFNTVKGLTQGVNDYCSTLNTDDCPRVYVKTPEDKAALLALKMRLVEITREIPLAMIPGYPMIKDRHDRPYIYKMVNFSQWKARNGDIFVVQYGSGPINLGSKRFATFPELEAYAIGHYRNTVTVPEKETINAIFDQSGLRVEATWDDKCRSFSLVNDGKILLKSEEIQSLVDFSISFAK